MLKENPALRRSARRIIKKKETIKVDDSFEIKSDDVIELMRKLKLGIELDEKDIQLKVALAELRLNLYDLSDLESPLNLRNPPPRG